MPDLEDRADRELDELLREHHRRLEAAADPHPAFGTALERQLTVTEPGRRGVPRPALAVASLALAVVLGGGAAAVLLGVRATADDPSGSPLPTTALVDESSSPEASASPTPTPEASETASPSASATSAPSHTPSASGTVSPSAMPTFGPAPQFAVDDWVAVAGEYVVYAQHEPGWNASIAGELPPGTEGIVIDGPVEVDGMRWYRVEVGRVSGDECGWRPPSRWNEFDEICGLSNGWVPVGSGPYHLEGLEPDCPPTPSAVGELAELSPATRLYCYGGEALTLDAYLPSAEVRPCVISGPIEPEWLYCEVLWLQGEEGPGWSNTPDIGTNPHPSLGRCWPEGSEERLPDECPFAPFVGEWFTVTGTYDHPEARTCNRPEARGDRAAESAHAAFLCRSTFVITDYVPPEG